MLPSRFKLQHHFPMQNALKMEPGKSSVVVWPVLKLVETAG